MEKGVLMKNFFKARIAPLLAAMRSIGAMRSIAIIAMVAVIGFSMTACGDEEDNGGNGGSQFNGTWTNESDATDIITINSPNWTRTKGNAQAGTLDFDNAPSSDEPNILNAGGQNIGGAEIDGGKLKWTISGSGTATFAKGSGNSGGGGNPGGGGDNISVTFNSVTANGSSSATTTMLLLIFSQEITGLSASDITLSGVAGVSKGTLGGSGTNRTLPISGFTAGGTLSVAVSKSGYNISGSPKTVTIYYYTSSGGGDISWAGTWQKEGGGEYDVFTLGANGVGWGYDDTVSTADGRTWKTENNYLNNGPALLLQQDNSSGTKYTEAWFSYERISNTKIRITRGPMGDPYWNGVWEKQ